MVLTDSVPGKPAVSSHKAECGEELFVSYGPHTNDFLLVECTYVSEILESLPV